jgi:hypothetical protein
LVFWGRRPRAAYTRPGPKTWIGLWLGSDRTVIQRSSVNSPSAGAARPPGRPQHAGLHAAERHGRLVEVVPHKRRFVVTPSHLRIGEMEPGRETQPHVLFLDQAWAGIDIEGLPDLGEQVRILGEQVLPEISSL